MQIFKATLFIMAPHCRHHRCPLSGKQMTQCGVPTRPLLSDRKNRPQLSSATQMKLRTTIPSTGSQTEQRTYCSTSFFCSFRTGRRTDCAVKLTRVALARRQDEALWAAGMLCAVLGVFLFVNTHQGVHLGWVEFMWKLYLDKS